MQKFSGVGLLIAPQVALIEGGEKWHKPFSTIIFSGIQALRERELQRDSDHHRHLFVPPSRRK